MILLYPVTSPHQVYALNGYSPDTVVVQQHQPTKKGFASVYEIQVSGEIIMSEEKEVPHFEDKEASKELKDKSKLFLLFPNFRKLC